MLDAEHAFREGMRLLRENQNSRALSEFRRAAEFQPAQAEYQMYAAWTESRCAKDEDSMQLVARAKARAFALKLLREDPAHGKAHGILGQLLYEEDEREAAERHFGLAVRSDPDDLDAQRWLRHLVRLRRRK